MGSRPLRIAIAQLPITGDVKLNSRRITSAMREAAEGKARLIQFPEGMLTGYRFGCMICIEVNFPELFMEYGELGIDCLLLSADPAYNSRVLNDPRSMNRTTV